MKGEFVKNTSIYVIIDFLVRGLTFLLWIVLAWFLDSSQIGVYALSLFLIEFFSTINILGLNAVIMRFYYHKDRISILSNALVVFLCSSFIVLSLFIFTFQWIPFLITGLSNFLKENFYLFLSIIFTTSIANIASIHYVTLKKTSFYSKLQLLKILLLSLTSFSLVYFGFGIQGVFFAHLLSTLAVAILFIMKERKCMSMRFVSPRVLKNITNYGFPLMLKASLGILVVYFGRILLDRYTNLATLGVYSFFLMFTLEINKLWSSFNQAWTPKIFSEFLEDREKVIKNVEFMTFLLSFLYLLTIALFIVIGELFLFKLIFKEIYLTDIYLFYILLLVPLFSGIYIVSYPLYYYESRTKRVLLISFLISGFDILLTFFVVRAFGQKGAALSVFIMSILSTFIYLLTFKKLMQIPAKIINWTFLLSVLMILSVGILLKTLSPVLFLIFVISGAILAYKIGRLSERKYLFLDLLKEMKEKVGFNTLKVGN